MLTFLPDVSTWGPSEWLNAAVWAPGLALWGCVMVGVARALLTRRRREVPFGEWYQTKFAPEIRRKVESARIAEMELKGRRVWRPDSNKLRK